MYSDSIRLATMYPMPPGSVSRLLNGQRVHVRRGRAGRDDRGTLAERGQRHLDRVDRADQVGVDHVRPGLQRRIALHRGDPGLCHHDVEPAQLGDSLLQCGAQLPPLTHVGLHRHDAPV